MKVGLFLDTFYPMVDGVIKVVDNYATRLAKKGEVVLFCPGVKGYDEAEDKKYPYEIVRCHSLPLGGLDYSLPSPVSCMPNSTGSPSSPPCTRSTGRISPAN